jgi:hypothetical protein
MYILKSLVKILKPNKVLETGMGFGSTKFFVDNGIHTTSIEMQSCDWYEKVCKEIKDNGLFTSYLSLGTSGVVEIIDSLDRFDFIFVDGHGENRWEQINTSFRHTNVIVTHDTEAMVYEWQNTKLPPGWSWIDFTGVSPWTSILTDNLDIISSLFSYKHKTYSDISNKDYLDRRRLVK